MKAAALALGCLLLVSSGLQADEGDGSGGGSQVQDTRQDLNAIRHAINAAKRTVRVQTAKERDELGTLQRLNRELDAARRDDLTHRHNLGLVRDRLALLGAAVGRVETEDSADSAFLKADLVALYKARTANQPLLLLSARDPGQLRLRARYLSVLASATRLRVTALREELGQLGSYRQEFDSRQVELQRRMVEVETDSRKVERERRGKEAQLRAVRGRKARALEAVRELRASADRLQGMLSTLIHEAQLRDAEQRHRAEVLAEKREAAARAGAQNAAQSAAQGAPLESEVSEGGETEENGGQEETYIPSNGHGLWTGLPWPVSGPIVSRFGKHLHPVFHVPVFNRGIEIAAAYGTPVRVVAPGTVDYAGELEGYGHLVVVDHGRGMLSVYGYGSRLRVRKGQVLRQGDIVEEIGEAAEERQPTLYFEIRRGARAQDPLHYLARR